MPADFLLWQLADSAFPTGGFAHSSGIEAAWQHGELRSREGFFEFLETSLKQLARASLPFVTIAHREPGRLSELDRVCEAFLSNHVANRASRLQGQCFLAATEGAFHSPALSRLRMSIRQEKQPVHFAPVFGAICSLLEVGHSSSVRLFVFLHLRGMIASAVRLGIIGPVEGQAMQHRLAPLAEQTACFAETLGLDDLAQTAPLLDLWQGAQDRLYSRLFQS